jgi:hypothetical protein
MARTMASTIKNFGDFIADMIVNAFNNPISADWWSVADGQFWFWVAVMAPVIMIIAIIQIGITTILQDWRRLGRVVAGATLAVPFSAFCAYGMKQFSAVTDAVTNSITATLQGAHGGSLGESLLAVMGLSQGTSNVANHALEYMSQATYNTSGVPYQMMLAGSQSASNIGQYVGCLLVVSLMALASLFLFIAMAIRTFGLLALAALAPVALMMIGQPKLGAWAQKWLSLTVGLLLAKPLAAGVLLLAVQLTGATANLGLLLTCAGAVVAAAFSPLWATKLVAFAGDEVGTALHRRASIREQVSRGSTAVAPARGVVRVLKVGR